MTFSLIKYFHLGLRRVRWSVACLAVRFPARSGSPGECMTGNQFQCSNIENVRRPQNILQAPSHHDKGQTYYPRNKAYQGLKKSVFFPVYPDSLSRRSRNRNAFVLILFLFDPDSNMIGFSDVRNGLTLTGSSIVLLVFRSASQMTMRTMATSPVILQH